MTNEQASSVAVGFDLGHGETALAVVSTGSTVGPSILRLPGSATGRHATAVSSAGNEVQVGNAALAGNGPLHAEFKSSGLADAATAVPVQLFVRQVVADLVESGRLDPNRPTRWVFGAPSAWSAQVREHYAQLLRSSLPECPAIDEVEVIAESRAAMLQARDSGEVPPRAFAGGGALIVDLGSSTADYTYVQDSRIHADFGNDHLGAWLIEDEIAEYVLSTHPRQAEIEERFAEDPGLRLRFRFACREAKEEFFKTSRDIFRLNPENGVHRRAVVRGRGESIAVAFELFPDTMYEILERPIAALGGKTWPQAYRDDLVDVLARCPKLPTFILLTGGASGMRFVVDITKEVAGPGVTVVIGREPEYAIARGLAIAGRVSVRTKVYYEELDALTPRIQKMVRDGLPGLAQALAATVATGVTERHVIPAFVAWRNGSITTLNGVNEYVATRVTNDLSSNSVSMERAMATWQNSLRPRVDDLTRPICIRADVDPATVAFPTVPVDTGTVVVSVPNDPATQALAVLTAAIGVAAAGVISTALFGGGIALVMTTGPFGVAVAFVAALVVALGGRQYMLDHAGDVDLWRWVRRARSEESLVGQLRSDATSLEATLTASLKDHILATSTETLTAQISSAIITSLRRLAAEAELQIR